MYLNFLNLQYYHLEPYLFDTVHNGFAKKGQLSAFDFFCILIWKANCAKSKHASRLLGGLRGFRGSSQGDSTEGSESARWGSVSVGEVLRGGPASGDCGGV